MISKLVQGFIVIMVGTTLSDNMFYTGNDCIGWTTEKQSTHKQTYEEYVQERLNVERMMR